MSYPITFHWAKQVMWTSPKSNEAEICTPPMVETTSYKAKDVDTQSY